MSTVKSIGAGVKALAGMGVSRVEPEDFAEANVVNLGEAGDGCWTITLAIKKAMTTLTEMTVLAADGGARVEGVQFYFNGTPAVVRVGDDIDAVYCDWNTRRTAFQRAAGIIN